VQMSVRDNGPGVAANVADRLFRPFATTKASGMGLGLSISRSIIEAHGGRIWLEPVPNGQGSDMRFTLPVSTDVKRDS
jgi:two-component system sensor kinase FixL